MSPVPVKRVPAILRLMFAGLLAAAIAGLTNLAVMPKSALAQATPPVDTKGVDTAGRNPLDLNGLPSAPIKSLKGRTPLLPDVSAYIDYRNPEAMKAARQLGKALFWDTQVGSDGNACASCHFHAGADIRTKNQVNPGGKGGDPFFGKRTNGSSAGPNQQFTVADFPFRQLADPTDRDSAPKYDTNNVFSSQGTFGGDHISSARAGNKFRGQNEDNNGLQKSDSCKLTYDPLHPDDITKGSPYHANGRIYRRVEPRNTPTMINAVFNLRQFWDGRANNQFNGVDPFGRRTYIQQVQDPFAPDGFFVGNPKANVTGLIVPYAFILAKSPAQFRLVQPLIQNASLASQATGTALSDFEMSCDGKSFPDLGRKLTPMRPLSTQLVSPDDSLFSKTPGLVNNAAVPGLNTTYQELIRKAFNPLYWSAPGYFTVDQYGIPRKQLTKAAGGYTLMEHNFSLFWGLAVQAYEQTLISDDSPFDRYMSGNITALNPAAVKGMAVFNSKGNCFECHAGAPLSSAAVTDEFLASPAAIEGMLMRDGHGAMYDGGYYNIGVRPAGEDLGIGGIDPYGFDLSYTRQYRWQLLDGVTPDSVDLFDVNRCTGQLSGGCLVVPNPVRDAVDGSFKAPQLRNVGLTPPYFHNGGTANLKDLVHFYNRGGDHQRVAKFGNNNDALDTGGGDTTGVDAYTPFDVVNKTNLAPGIGEPVGSTSGQKGLGMTEEEMNNLVEFLLSLTDDRVACHSDVFDHPELPLVMGQQEATSPGSQVARDFVATLPATGQTYGLRSVAGECFPNTGDLFGSLNKNDPRQLQRAAHRILRSPDRDFDDGNGGSQFGGDLTFGFKNKAKD